MPVRPIRPLLKRTRAIIFHATNLELKRSELRRMQLPINRLRPLLLMVVTISMLATLAELLLLEHTESRTQWIPLGLLILGLLSAVLVTVWPRRSVFGIFRTCMALFVMGGLLGFYLHYRGNALFELEMNPALKGAELVHKTMMGATPTLSPGVLCQLGLLGLLYTFRHPRLQAAGARPEEAP